MITIIHGEDTVSSRKYFIQEKQKSQRWINFSEENINLTNLAQAIEGDSLLFTSEKKEIFIEDLFPKKPSKEFISIISYLEKHARTIDIKIWESKELSKKQLNSFRNIVIKSFNLPKSLFLFLDELKPQNGKKLINLFHKALETTEVELIFYMMTRQFRLLLALCDKSEENQIDELKRIAPWQKSKLQKQVGLFSITNLKNIYKKICSIEVLQKTGADILSLPQAIDFFLLSI